MKEISSLHNPLIKQVILLQNKSRERKKTGLFIIEGQREIRLAQEAGYQLQTLLINRDKHKIDELQLDEKKLVDTEIITINNAIYSKLAYREGTEGYIAIAQTNDHNLQNCKIAGKNPLILVAEAPEKPGNIGALLRTADAAAVDAVIIANPKTDLYNPNIIRSSVGCIFTNRVFTGTTQEIITFLKRKKIAIYAAALQASVPYTKVNFKGPTAIVVGTEATGLNNEWLENSHQNILIPMQGKIDSMNVSAAAAILIFEACRQRGFKEIKTT